MHCLPAGCPPLALLTLACIESGQDSPSLAARRGVLKAAPQLHALLNSTICGAHNSFCAIEALLLHAGTQPGAGLLIWCRPLPKDEGVTKAHTPSGMNPAVPRACACLWECTLHNGHRWQVWLSSQLTAIAHELCNTLAKYVEVIQQGVL